MCPFFPDVLKLYDDQKLAKDKVETMFLETETYLFGGSICNSHANTCWNNEFWGLSWCSSYSWADANKISRVSRLIINKKQ